MSLLEIKQYLMQVKIASIEKLSAHFHCESDVLRNMIGHWMRKGCIRQFVQSAACGKTCGKCAIPPSVEIYEWVDSATLCLSAGSSTL